jgi:hypothetical protein
VEIDKSFFYPLTPFHLICSTILRDKLKFRFNVLILDSNLFDKTLISNIRDSNNWDKIFVIKKSSDFLTSLHSTEHLNEFLFYVDKEIFNVFYFSLGVNTCNLFINKLSEKHNFFLCDDGLAPYYFNQNVFEFWIKFTKKNILRNILFKLIYIFTGNNYQCTFKNNIQLIILNKDLSDLVINEHIVLNIENEDKLLALKEVSTYYSNLLPVLRNNFKIVFFHSDNKDIDLSIYLSLLKKYSSHEIFHCFRQRAYYTDLVLYSIHNNNVPWEILHYKYLTNFNDCVLISLNITTAFIDTINPYIGSNKRFIVKENYLEKPTLFDEILRLVNQNSHKPLCFINTIDEL